MKPLIVGLSAMLLLTGCSDSVSATTQSPASDAAAIRSPSGRGGLGGSGATATPSPGPHQGAAGATLGASGSPDTAGLPTGPRASSPRITVILGAACVALGGQQTIYIATQGQASVSYNTHYADGKLGGDYGGVGIGVTDATGVYRGAWTVSGRAALGTATIDAGMSQGGTWATAPGVSFSVATHC
jgi:hypothetical protein